MDLVESEHPLSIKLKRAEWRLGALEAEHADLDVRHATLVVELEAFRRVYLRRLGPLFATLDALRARLAARLAARAPFDAGLRQQADEAEHQAQQSAREASSAEAPAPGESPRFEVDDRCKELRRKAAKVLHPDRAETDADRELRNRLMAEVNRAMRDNDAERIQELMDEYAAKSTVKPSSGVIEERLASVQRLSARLEGRITSLQTAVRDLLASELHILRERAKEGEKNDNDVLAELESELATLISDVEAKLSEEETVVDPLATRSETHSAQFPEPPETVTESPPKDDHERHANFHARGLRHRTARGEFVRSKSEVIIADALYRSDIRYEYEAALVVAGRRVRPDFLIKRETGRHIVWEHLGMLGDETYRRAWEAKEQAYLSAGYDRAIDLIISEDTPDGAIDSWQIESLVRSLGVTLAKNHDGYIVLDFETTGTSPDTGARVIEIGAVHCRHGQAIETFTTLVNPGVSVPSHITDITGITTRMLQGAPDPASALGELVAFIGDRLLLAHNASFDRRFLRRELANLGLDGSRHTFACTLKLARRTWPGRSSYKLGSLADAFGLKARGNLHRALADADLTTQLWARILKDQIDAGRAASEQAVFIEGRMSP